MPESKYYSELIESSLVENGKLVRLHFVIHTPAGKGPFSTVVFNHGSTGYGANPEYFKMQHDYQPIADFFVPKGWMVICPHRRGRGNSEGEYREGLDENGYSCDLKIALEGVKRATEDLFAAMEIINTIDEVDNTNIILGGHSRGGLLSIAYAANNPNFPQGVISFVGGWVAEDCSTALDINASLAKNDGTYPKQTLWLYGCEDQFYSLDHTKKLFEQFINAGGKGEFVAFETADHSLLWTCPDWQRVLSEYLVGLGYSEFQGE